MDIVGLLVTLLVMGLVFYLVVWLIDWVAVPDPFNKVIKAIVGIVCVIYLLGILLGQAPPLRFWR